MTKEYERQKIHDTIMVGRGVVISFGSKGEQYAHCVGYGRAEPGLLHRARRVRIWRKQSHRWTKPRKLQVAEVIRLATDEDKSKFKPDFGRAWEWN